MQSKVRGGGICVYTKLGLNAEVVDLPSIPSQDMEAGCISLYNDQRGTIYCTTIYRLLRGDPRQALKSLDDIINFLFNKKRGEI